MQKPDTPENKRWIYLWLVVLLALPAFAWLGVIDQYASETIGQSTTAAGLIYATARGINALVSMLQGTELDMLVLTFSIGEVLDPVNDLIERFSTLVFFALGSLALQKILLSLVSHTLFNAVLSLFALAAATSLFVGHKRLISTLLKSFIAVALVRFSLGLVVIANGWVDATFLDEADGERHTVMINLQSELRDIEAIARNDRAASALLTSVRGDMANLETRNADLRYQIKLADEAINEQSLSLDHLVEKEGLPCTYIGVVIACPEHIDKAAANLEKIQVHRKALADDLNRSMEALEKAEENAACLAKRQRGEECSFWERIPHAPNPVALQNKLSRVNENLSEFADNCVNLLMSLLLKTLLIPLLFIYLLLKVLRSNWIRM